MYVLAKPIFVAVLAFAVPFANANMVEDRKAMLELSRIGSEIPDSELDKLLGEEAVLFTILDLPTRGKNFGNLNTLLKDKVNGARIRELQILMKEQLEAIKNIEDTTIQTALVQLFVDQLDTIANSDNKTLAAYEIAGLTVINQVMMKEADKLTAITKESTQLKIARSEAKALNGQPLKTLVMGRSEIVSSPSVVGSMALEFVLAQTESGKQLAYEALTTVVKPESIDNMLKTLNGIQEYVSGRAAFEREIFVEKLTNDPMFAATVIGGLGAGVMGVVTGSPMLILSGVWSIGGDRLRAIIPINKMLLWLGKFSLQIAKLGSAEEREAALSNLKTLMFDTAGSLSTQAMETLEYVTSKETLGRLADGAKAHLETVGTVINKDELTRVATIAGDTALEAAKQATDQVSKWCGWLLTKSNKPKDPKE